MKFSRRDYSRDIGTTRILRTEELETNHAGGGILPAPGSCFPSAPSARPEGNNSSLKTVIQTKRQRRMTFTRVTLLATCLVSMPGAISVAKDSPSFKILSTSIAAPAKPRALPEFSLVERSGKKITLAELRGKVWIADFIYTNCADTCPLQTADMAKLQEHWINESDLELVSFSIDPERDTPRVLLRYAARFKADAKRWLFLTGGKKEIARLVEDSQQADKDPRLLSQSRPERIAALKTDVATLLNEKLDRREKG